MEMLKTFDHRGNVTGVATREEVHRLGLWHETFHCWIVCREEGVDYIYLQLRSDKKKDYPSLLDITAAGHLLSIESVEDGVREVEEELGIEVAFRELESLGVIGYTIISEELIDKEFAHNFVYKATPTWDAFTLQTEEVAGIVRTEFSSFMGLWKGNVESIKIEGILINEQGVRCSIEKNVGKESFVPHPLDYFEKVLERIEEKLRVTE